MQIAELDAHAYGCLIMESWFGLTPIWKDWGISDKVVKEIQKYKAGISGIDYD